MRLGRALKLMRVTSGQTLDEMSKEIGIERTKLHRIENNKPCEPRAVIRLVVWLIDKETAA